MIIKLSLNRIASFLLLILICPSCKKLDGDNETGIMDEGVPTIRYTNNINAPIELTVNGKTDTLAYLESRSIKGDHGILVKAVARSVKYKSSSRSFGATSQPTQMIGEIVEIKLDTSFPESGVITNQINIPDGYYLLSLRKNTKEELINNVLITYYPYGTEDYEFASSTVKNNIPAIVTDPVKHNGVSTPIGFFKVVSRATFIFRSLSGADRVFRGVEIGDGDVLECEFR